MSNLVPIFCVAGFCLGISGAALAGDVLVPPGRPVSIEMQHRVSEAAPPRPSRLPYVGAEAEVQSPAQDGHFQRHLVTWVRDSVPIWVQDNPFEARIAPPKFVFLPEDKR